MMNVTWFRRFSGAALAALALSVPAVSRAQTTYTIVDLGAPTGTSSVGCAINSSGQVAGYLTSLTDGSTRAVVWTGTTMTYLSSLSGGYGINSAAYGINDSGQITGYSNLDTNYPSHAVVWTGTTPTDLGALQSSTSQGNAINASGQVAGYFSNNGTARAHPARWTGTTGVRLPDYNGYGSQGLAINASGQIAGYAVVGTGNGVNATMWTGTQLTTLNFPGASNSGAAAINNSGQVAGYVTLPTSNGSPVTHAALWTGTTATDLTALYGGITFARGINAAGDIVGSNGDGYGNANTAAFLCGNGRVVALNTVLPTGSGWVLNEARAINDSGWITGQGTLNGQVHAFLLKPDSVTVTGKIGLEGVADFAYISPGAPLGMFHIGFRTPGATTEIYGSDAALTTTPGSPFGAYTVPNVPPGVYDVTFKGSKNLRLLLPNVTVSGPTTLTTVTLAAGDANNDNSVDSADFGILIGAFNGEADIPGSGYDATADFNFDGFVDSVDFALLINEYNNAGAL